MSTITSAGKPDPWCSRHLRVCRMGAVMAILVGLAAVPDQTAAQVTYTEEGGTLADGTAWFSANYAQHGVVGTSCAAPDNNVLATSGGTYTVTGCNGRVLARCG